MCTAGEMLPTEEYLGQKPVPVQLCPPQTHTDWSWIEPRPPH